MNITVLGTGAWGTALAVHFALHGHRTAMWTHNAGHAAQIRTDRSNQRYLPGFRLPENVSVHEHLDEALQHANLIVAAVPVAGLRGSMEAVKACGFGRLPVLAACKGFEADTGLLNFQVLQDVLPDNDTLGILSGPSFARELAAQQPCAVCLSSENGEWVRTLAAELNTPVMRLYANDDAVGVAVGGAVKNVMAIATGISDGLGCGMNARAALVTRGLAEMSRLAAAMGARPSTLTGLSGMGDLLLTCTGLLSRNRQVGLGLAEGKPLHQVLAEIGHVAEGVSAIDEVYNAAARHRIDMPVTAALYRLVRNELSPQDIVEGLMRREPTSE